MPMNSRLLRPLARFQEPAPNPVATLVSTKSAGDVSGTASGTGGSFTVEWWDGTATVYGNAATWSKAAAGGGEKTIKIYSSDANGDPSGTLTLLVCSNNSLTSLDVSGCAGLSYLDCSANSLTSLEVSGLALLLYLIVQSNSLTSLDVSGCAALVWFYHNNNPLISLNASGCVALPFMNVSQPTLTALDVSGCTSLSYLWANNSSLTSVRAVGVGTAVYAATPSAVSSYYSGVMVANNNLDAVALDQLYADLADNTPSGQYALVLVGGNPGTTGDNPAIATVKNWIVLGS